MRPGRAGCGLPQRVADGRRLLLDFLPYVEGTIQRYGVMIDEILYYDDVLARHVSAPEPNRRGVSKRKFIFRRDPRDISRAYFFTRRPRNTIRSLTATPPGHRSACGNCARRGGRCRYGLPRA